MNFLLTQFDLSYKYYQPRVKRGKSGGTFGIFAVTKREKYIQGFFGGKV